MATRVPTRIEDEDYDGFEADALKYVKYYNKNIGKSVKYAMETFEPKHAKPIAASIIAAQFGGAIAKKPGESEDEREKHLDLVESYFFVKGTKSYAESREALEREDPMDFLIPKPHEKLGQDHTRNIMDAFYSPYGEGEEERREFTKDRLEEFFKGVKMKLGMEGKTFTDATRHEYNRMIQCEPTIMCLNSAVDLKKELKNAGIPYQKFYNSIDDLGQALRIVKKLREGDILEGLKQDLVYVTKESLDYAGMSRDEFVDYMKFGGNGELEAKAKKVVKREIHMAFPYLKRGAETIMELPDEGIYLGTKRFGAAYGGFIKHIVDGLVGSDYNPRNGKGYMAPGPEEEERILQMASSAGRGKGHDRKIAQYLLSKDSLDKDLLTQTGEQIGYSDLK